MVVALRSLPLAVPGVGLGLHSLQHPLDAPLVQQPADALAGVPKDNQDEQDDQEQEDQLLVALDVVYLRLQRLESVES